MKIVKIEILKNNLHHVANIYINLMKQDNLTTEELAQATEDLIDFLSVGLSKIRPANWIDD